MPKTIQVPDNTLIDFPDTMQDSDIEQAMQKLYPPSASAGVAPSVPNPILKASQMETSLPGYAVPVAQKTAQVGSDVLQGIGEGTLHTAATIGKITDPITRQFATPAQMQTSDANIQRLTTPDNPVQAAARTAEQVGEFFLPTGAEETAVSHLPQLAKYIKPAVGIAETGLKNVAQGGDLGTGLAAGAGGELLGAGARAVAPKLAEGAVGLTAKLRRPGSSVGKAILEETSGLAPSKIAASSQAMIDGLNRQLETAAAQSTNVASTQPALQVILNEVGKASEKNAGPTLDKLDALWNQLTKEYGTGQPISSNLSPSRILALKRGVGDLVTRWTPAEQKSFNPILKQVYGALDGELDRTVPEAADLNQRMSNLIPANRRANVTASSAPLSQRVLSRVARPTGALVGAGIGYHEGGTPGAMVGLIAPEIIASPTARMAYARALQSGVIPKVAVAAGLQANRPTNMPAQSQPTLGQQAADYIESLKPDWFGSKK